MGSAFSFGYQPLVDGLNAALRELARRLGYKSAFQTANVIYAESFEAPLGTNWTLAGTATAPVVSADCAAGGDAALKFNLPAVQWQWSSAQIYLPWRGTGKYGLEFSFGMAQSTSVSIQLEALIQTPDRVLTFVWQLQTDTGVLLLENQTGQVIVPVGNVKPFRPYQFVPIKVIVDTAGRVYDTLAVQDKVLDISHVTPPDAMGQLFDPYIRLVITVTNRDGLANDCYVDELIVTANES